ncbi:MAG: ATP synthase subunit I [Thermodesulfovibrionales bacterium]
MEVITRRVVRWAFFLLVPLSLLSLPFAGWRFSLSLLLGGGMGAANLTGLAWSVRLFLGEGKAQAKMLVVSIFRFLILFVLLVVLAAAGVLAIGGVLIGFTVVFLLILAAGLSAARKEG